MASRSGELNLCQFPSDAFSGICSGKRTKSIKGIHRTKTNISKFYNDIGYISFQNGDHKKAIFYFNKVIDLNLDKDMTTKSLINRGVAKKELGDISGACSDVRKGYQWSLSNILINLQVY